MTFPFNLSWDWEHEIKEAHIARRLIPAFTKDGAVYIKEDYFTALAKQMQDRVTIVLSTFPVEHGYFYLSPSGYDYLRKYLPLPPLEDLARR